MARIGHNIQKYWRKFWKSKRDSEQATVLLNGFKERVDLEYLGNRVQEEKVDDVLSEVGKTNG